MDDRERMPDDHETLPPSVRPSVRRNMDEVRGLLNVPLQAEVEESPDPRLACLMATPFLTAEEFSKRTVGAKAILFCTFASGAMPDRLTPIMEQRIAEGIPIIVISDNAGNEHGILSVIYAAGEKAYKAGAFPLQKVNIKHHREIKAAIVQALNEGKTAEQIIERMRKLYSFKAGEKLPLAEWERPDDYQPFVPEPVDHILRKSGFVDDDGNYIPYKP